MNNYILAILIGCMTISLPIDAIGRGNGKMGMSQAPVFSEVDVNQDGLISHEEFIDFHKDRQESRKSKGHLLRHSANSEDMFEQIDINHDSFIDIEEFQSHKRTMRSSSM